MDLVAPESATARAAAEPVSVRAAAAPATAPVGAGSAAARAPVVVGTASDRVSAQVQGTAPVRGMAPGPEVVGARVTAVVPARAATAASARASAAPVWASAARVAAGTAVARASVVPGVPAGSAAPVARAVPAAPSRPARVHVRPPGNVAARAETSSCGHRRCAHRMRCSAVAEASPPPLRRHPESAPGLRRSADGTRRGVVRCQPRYPSVPGPRPRPRR